MQPELVHRAARELNVDGLTRLAEGGQKYAGRGISGGQEVVLKVVELKPPNAAEALERAKREVALLAGTDHANIVRVVSELVEVRVGGLHGAAWAEEFLDGEDLSAQLSVPWSWVDARRMGSDIARGLGALHSRDPVVVHRDVSPGNVRCLSDGSFKVMDPGFARHIGRTSLTGMYQPGTPGFLTPEHVPPAKPSPASDVFAVGILLYRALTGDLPFPLTAAIDGYLVALRDRQALSVRVARPDLGPEQGEVVDRCLQRQSARRYLDGNELAVALEQAP